jgi:DNA-binding PadR family transcriptional regulator
MDTLVKAGAAVLQALLEGPAYGAALSQLLLKRTSGQVRLGHSNVYAALTALERTGLVRSWTVVPGGSRGARARVYHELTPRGIEVASVQRRALAGLLALAPAAAATEPERDLMLERLQRCSEVSAAVQELRDAMPAGRP